MTRINVRYLVEYLCDQHLLAEYRELPRVFGHVPKGYIPPRFTLGKGHVNWCSQFQASLMHRQYFLCREMLHRGFAVNYPMTRDDVIEGPRWTDADCAYARPIVEQRIKERLQSMRRTPTWTRRLNPYA